MNKLFLLIVMIAAIGCQQSHANNPQQVTTVSSQQPVVKEQPILAETVYIDTCLTGLYPDTWLDTVIAHPKKALTDWDDDCVLSTISLLKTNIISEHCTRCMDALNKIANVSDGYVGEYLIDVCGELYYEAFETFITYLASVPSGNDELIRYTTRSFYFEMTLQEDIPSPETRRSEILYDISQKMKGRPEAQQQVLKKLEKKVKEITYDR